jgi:hypothetical protein
MDSYGMEALQTCIREIEKVQRNMKAIESINEKAFKNLYRYEAQWMRLQVQSVVYKVDVELDQILTF